MPDLFAEIGGWGWVMLAFCLDWPQIVILWILSSQVGLQVYTAMPDLVLYVFVLFSLFLME
jgi:hypothetical protein